MGLHSPLRRYGIVPKSAATSQYPSLSPVTPPGKHDSNGRNDGHRALRKDTRRALSGTLGRLVFPMTGFIMEH